MLKLITCIFLCLSSVNGLNKNICEDEYFNNLRIFNFIHNSTLYKAFISNCHLINEHNSKVNKSDSNALILGLNHLAFLTFEKFKKIFSEDYVKFPNVVNHNMNHCMVKSKHVNWNERGAVTPVKNQFLCGSCYAFGATAAIESAHFLVNKELISLSEQETIDCNPNVNGCNGGNAVNVFEYAMTNGISLKRDYRYRGWRSKCHKFNVKVRKVKISGYCSINRHSDCLMNAIEKYGPISVYIDTHCFSFQFYRKGILSCSNKNLKFTHVVLAYGYHLDKDPNQSYYMLKNSWGTLWGEHGHFKLTMKELNDLGITYYAFNVFVNDTSCY